MRPIIADDVGEASGQPMPTFVPSHGECWRRIRLAMSILGHRPPSRETHDLVRDILDGSVWG